MTLADADALFRLANASFLRGDAAAALQQIDAAIDRQPGRAMLHANRGLILHYLGRLPDALASYDRAVALMPENADCANGRGPRSSFGQRKTRRLWQPAGSEVVSPDQARGKLSDLEVEFRLEVEHVVHASGSRHHLTAVVLPFKDEIGLRHRRVDDVQVVIPQNMLQICERCRTPT